MEYTVFKVKDVKFGVLRLTDTLVIKFLVKSEEGNTLVNFFMDEPVGDFKRLKDAIHRLPDPEAVRELKKLVKEA